MSEVRVNLSVMKQTIESFEKNLFRLMEQADILNIQKQKLAAAYSGGMSPDALKACDDAYRALLGESETMRRITADLKQKYLGFKAVEQSGDSLYD